MSAPAGPPCAGWPSVTLGELATDITKGESIQWQGEAYQASGIPFIRTVNVQPHGLDLSHVAFVSPESHARMTRSQLRANDLLISIAGTLGRSCIVPAACVPANINQDVALVRIERNDIHLPYVLWALRSGLVAHQIHRVGRGAGRIHLNLQQVRSLGFPLPPLPEQRRIAALLDKADGIRRKRQQAIRLADDLLRSAFLDMFGNAVRAAHRWTPVPLATLCTAIVDCPHSTPAYAPSRTAYPCVRTSDLQNGFLDFSTTKYVDAGEYTARIGRMAPAAGDVLYSREGERFGIATIVPPGITPCLGQRMMLLRADEAVARPAFLWALMNSPAFYSRVAQLAGGSTSPHVNVVDIKRLPAFLPPVPLQARFERLVERTAAIRNGIMDAVPTADDLLHCLAQRAFRGDK